MIVEPKREILLVPLLRAGIKRAWIARDHFLRLGIVPLAGLLLLAGSTQEWLNAMATSVSASGADQAGAGLVLHGIFLGLLEGAVLSLFAVNWIRQLTLGPAAVPGIGLAVAGRHVRFFIVMAAITVGVLFPAFVLAAIALLALQSPAAGMFIAFVLGMLLLIAVIVRTSPSWIGIAIDARLPMGVAWNRTAGQGFKLLVAVLAIQVVTMVVRELAAEALAVTGFIAVAPYSFLLLAFAIGLAGLAVQVSILVTAFPHFLRETV